MNQILKMQWLSNLVAMPSRVVKLKLFGAFVCVCLVGMILGGYIFNFLQPFFM